MNTQKLKKILKPFKPILKPIRDIYLKRHKAQLNKEAIQNAYKAVQGILASTDAEFNDYDFIHNKIKEFGLSNQ